MQTHHLQLIADTEEDKLVCKLVTCNSFQILKRISWSTEQALDTEQKFMQTRHLQLIADTEEDKLVN